MHRVHGLLLQAVDTAGNLDTSGITAAGTKIRTLLLVLIGICLGLFVATYVLTHIAGGLFHMWGGFPWADKEHKTTGKELHDRAHQALMHVGIKAPLMVALVGIVIGIVASITGFAIPLDWSTVTGALK